MKNLEIFEQNRVKILKTLFLCKGDSCGCDLLSQIKISKHLLSYHLRVLREKGWILSCRNGRYFHYKINPEKRDQIKKALNFLEVI